MKSAPINASPERVRFSDLFGPGLAPITLTVLASTAMNSFEGLAVATVLPDIADDLGRIDLIGWVVTAYLIPSAVVGVAAGSLVDSVGARLTYRIGVLGFIVGSVLAALAPTLAILIGVRVVQGAAAGMVISAALSSIGIVLPVRLRSRSMAAASTVWGVMGMGAPALGAVINEFSGWRAVMWAIVPIAGVAAVAGWNSMPEVVGSATDPLTARADAPASGSSSRSRFDVVGLAILAAFTVALILGLSKVAVSSIPFLVGAGAVAVGLWLWLRQVGNPLFNPREVLTGPYLLPNLAPLGAMAAVPGFNSYIALYARVAGDQQGIWAAIGILGVTLGWTTGANIASRVLDFRPERSVIGAGYGLMGVGLVIVAVAAPGVHLGVVYGGLFIAGLGVGATANSSFLLLQRVAPDSAMGRASSMHQYVRAVGVTIGVAVTGAVIFATVEMRGGDAEQIRDALGETADSVSVDADAAQALASGFGYAALGGAALLLVIAAIVVLAGKSAPTEDLPG